MNLVFRCVFIVGVTLFLSAVGAQAQYVKITGVVSDSNTQEAIPFVNVVFKGKNIGTTTDINGRYTLESQWGSKELVFSSLGYALKTVPLGTKSNQTINVQLSPNITNLKTFEVQGEKKRYRNKNNPAVSLIKNVLAHRDENRGKTFDFFEYEKYTKSKYDLNNFTESWLDKRAMKDFQVLRDYIDTSDLNGKPFIPMLMQEKISSVYEKDHGATVKEYIQATQVSGVNSEGISSGIDQFMSKIGGDVDIYESKILLFDKSFTSPISPIGPTIYRYYITDSMKVDDVWVKKLAFVPRNHTMIAFTGFMWVGDSTMNYGVKSIELNIDKKMNINFLDDFRITQDFVHDSVIGWHVINEKMIIDFQAFEKGVGVFNTKTVSYSGFKVNVQRPDSVYKGLNEVSYVNSDTPRDEDYWLSNRHDSLTDDEEGVYLLTDSIQNIPAFKTLNTAVKLLGSAYITLNKVDIGPVTSLLSYNTVEGFRVRAGFRTNKGFHENWRVTAWGAYGFSDEKFKYYGKLEYYFNKNPMRRFLVSYRSDVYQPGFAITNIPPDHYMLSFRGTPSVNMFYEDFLRFDYQHEWFNGFSNNVELKFRNIKSTAYNTMKYAVTEEIVPQITDNTITIGARFSINERFIQGDFQRQEIKTTAPVFKFKYTHSSELLGSDYSYDRLFLRIEKRFMPGVLGFTDVALEGNKIFGKVAYPLLIIHRGNSTISYERNAFNLMNFMEYASDESAALFVEHHFNGLIFGFFPGLKHTKMRVVISGKFLVGTVSAKNSNPNDSSLILKPERFSLDGQPLPVEELYPKSLDGQLYAEGSIGIENIFKIMRIDLVKRFTNVQSGEGTFSVAGLAPRIAFKLKF